MRTMQMHADSQTAPMLLVSANSVAPYMGMGVSYSTGVGQDQLWARAWPGNTALDIRHLYSSGHSHNVRLTADVRG